MHGQRRVRIDAGSDLEPGRGSLLGKLGRRSARVFVAPAPEQRLTPRHQVECFAWVGWKSWRRFHMNDALLVNLSRGGASIFLDVPPPHDRPVWVFLETPSRRSVVKARVRDVQMTARGQCAARVAFDEPCPYAFFEAAVCGLAAANPKLRLRPTKQVTSAAPVHKSAG
jgi:hypothetical protein